ncbi:MAG: hypothetical protein IPL25_19825 [Saprospiraceae bacterium]|nr:hypothetical protein [Candidatus Vicinibacter affinis]
MQQSFVNLNHLEGNKTKPIIVTVQREQAETMAKRCDNVISFTNRLSTLSQQLPYWFIVNDWSKYTKFPVCGMPHYNDAKTLIVASGITIWKSFNPQLSQLPKELAQQISNTYSDKDNTLTMRDFFSICWLFTN